MNMPTAHPGIPWGSADRQRRNAMDEVLKRTSSAAAFDLERLLVGRSIWASLGPELQRRWKQFIGCCACACVLVDMLRVGLHGLLFFSLRHVPACTVSVRAFARAGESVLTSHLTYFYPKHPKVRPNKHKTRSLCTRTTHEHDRYTRKTH